VATDGQVVYRLLGGVQPAKTDFRSDEVANRPLGPDEPWIEHAGVSMFDDLNVALQLVQRFPVHVAELELPPDAGCSIAKTGPPRHFTVWGEPKRLYGCVRNVFRQNHEGASVESTS